MLNVSQGLPHHYSTDIKDSVISEAISSLKGFSDEALARISETFGANPSAVVQLSDGRSVPHRDCLAFAKAMNVVVERARQMLASTVPAPELLQQLIASRDQIQSQHYHSVPAPGGLGPQLKNFASYDDALNYANTSLLQVVHQIASGQPLAEMEIRAHDLAIMSLRSCLMRFTIERQWIDRLQEVRAHADLMREAYRRVDQDPSLADLYPYAVSKFEKAFLVFCDLKLEQQGFIPPVHFIHDLDANLVPVEDSHLKPGNVLGKIADELDAVEKLPGAQRLPLADSLTRIPHHKVLGDEMFRHAGKETHQLFEDVNHVMSVVEQFSLPTTIMTGNFGRYAEGVAQQFQPRPTNLQILGKKADDDSSQYKAHRLAEIFLQDPSAVLVFSDDRDVGICDAVVKGSMLPTGNGNKIPPQEICFIASRVRGDGETEDRALARTLKEQRVLFGENSLSVDGDSVCGYQAMRAVAEAYKVWRMSRESEGWPTTRLGAQAQERICEVVARASEVISELDMRLEGEGAAKIQEWLRCAQGTRERSQLMYETSLVERKLWLLRNGGSGLDVEALKRIASEYSARTLGLANNESRKRNVIATKIFRTVQQEMIRRGRGIRSDVILPGEVHYKMMGREKVALVQGPAVSVEDFPELIEREDFKHALHKEGVQFVIARLYTPATGSEVSKEQVLILLNKHCSPQAREKFRAFPKSEASRVLGGAGLLLEPKPAARSHEAQIELFWRHLNSYITVAEVYYRNGYAPAGGLEKTIRGQAEVLADWGFSVRILGGNAPDQSNYPAETLGRFEHRVIDGAHERDALVKSIAEKLYKGEVHQEYYSLYSKLHTALRDNLEGVDTIILHNPLFLRNVPMTQALVSLVTDGELPGSRCIGWVHDIARFTEPHNFPEKVDKGSPWFFADRRFPAIHYVPVSQAVADKLTQVPYSTTDSPREADELSPVNPGSDYRAMSRKNRVTRLLQDYINWDAIDQLWVTPGRVADRKHTIGAIEAVALIDRGSLIITGVPKIELRQDPVTRETREVVNDAYYDLLKEMVREMGIEHKVIFLADIPGIKSISDHEYEDVFAALVELADGTVTVPKEEGFGIDPRNAALLKPVTVVSDDPALIANLGIAARYVPRESHPIHAALEMVSLLDSQPNWALRRAARTSATWEAELRKILHLLGTHSADPVESIGITPRQA